MPKKKHTQQDTNRSAQYSKTQQGVFLNAEIVMFGIVLVYAHSYEC
jgi:hypothetical protein